MEHLLTPAEGGADLMVRVTPRASRSAISGLTVLADGRLALAVRIAAPPVDGAANAALIELLAGSLHLRRRAIRIMAGDGSRLKRVHLPASPADLLARLRTLGIAADSESDSKLFGVNL